MFEDRSSAGKLLAAEARKIVQDPRQTVVIALPRGGVPVAAELAQALNLPLDILVIRKLGYPLDEEFGFGAIAPGGFVYTDPGLVKKLNLTKQEIAAVVAKEERELKRRVALYRGSDDYSNLQDKDLIVVDDGLATGATMLAATGFLREQLPERIIVAAPVAAAESVQKIQPFVDEIICLNSPVDFLAVGDWYNNFPQLTDEEVEAIMQEF